MVSDARTRCRLAVLAGALAALVACVIGAGGAWATPRAHDASLERAHAMQHALLALVDLGGRRHGMTLSPDGRTIAVFRRTTRLLENDYRYELLLVPLDTPPPLDKAQVTTRDTTPATTPDMAAARIIADAGDAILHTADGRPSGALADRIARWSPDGRELAYLAHRQDVISLERVRIADGGVRVVATGPGDIADFAWLADGGLVFRRNTTRIAQARAWRDGAVAGYRVDDAFDPAFSLRPQSIARGDDAVFVAAPDGRLRAAAPQEAARLAPSPAPAGAIDNAADASGRRAWLAPRHPGDRAYRPTLAVFTDHDGRALMCADPACQGRLTRVWRTREEVIFQKAEGFADVETALYGWRPDSGRVRLIRRADDLLNDCALAAARLICLHEAALSPRRVVAVALSDGRLAAIHDPNPSWRGAPLTAVERLDGHDHLGNAFFARIVRPAGHRRTERYPLVIVQYRARGFLRAGTGGEYPIHMFAARGYLVASMDRPDPRTLHAELSAADLSRRTEFDGSEQSMKQSALETLIARLDARGLIDTGRIAITGMSDGAETVYWALTRPTAFAAAVTSSPPIDPSAWTLSSERFRRLRRAEDAASGDWPDANPDWAAWWARNTTTRRAEHIVTPLLMNLSESEALRGFPLASRLNDLGKPVETYIYPGAFHAKWRPQQILAAQTRALDWIDFWLLDALNPAPDDPGRAGRWRAMRDDHRSRLPGTPP